MVVQFIQKRGNAWRYRRKVPAELRARIGKREIAIPLGGSEEQALRRYPAVHAFAERLLVEAARPQAQPLPPTAIDLHKDAERYVTALGLDAAWNGWGERDDREGVAREVLADEIAAKYPVDEEGHPVGITPPDAALLQALMKGLQKAAPAPTLEDARRLYLTEKVKDNGKRRKQLDRIFGLVAEVVKLTTPLTELRRAHAREVRDNMLDGRQSASVQRYLNTLKAVITYAAREYDLRDFTNPFSSLSVQDSNATPDRRKRDVFTDEELGAVRARVMSSERADLRLIWRLLENTGCRLAEITGLRRVDVRLDHPTPHISIEGHEQRRIKTVSSYRLVPLLGDAVDAAREALELAGDSDVLFPAYCRDGGADSASAALGKHVRACVKRPKVTTYSLRHRIADRLDLAEGVSDRERDLVLGHTRGKTSETYGGEAARLELAKRALAAALKVGTEERP